MNSIDLIKDWRVCGTGEKVSLPCSLSSVDAAIAADLPITKGKAVLDVDGAAGGADVFIGGQCVGRALSSRTLIDVSGFAPGVELRLGLGRGGSLARSVRLFTAAADAYVLPYGVFVRTEEIADGGATLIVTVDVRNDGKKRKLGLDLAVLNHKGRRVCRRKKYFTFGPGDRTVSVPVKMRKAFPYLPGDPYMYTMSVSLVEEDGRDLDRTDVQFGVCEHGRYAVTDKLVGCTLAHSNGVLGDLSFPEAEMRKLSSLRDLGYNTVRYIGCPSDSALRVTDDLGLRVIVDIFDNWSQPRGGTDAHVAFAYDRLLIAANAVRSLRNHPSVIMYSIGNCVEESYGRTGADKEDEILALVRALDDSRPVTAALTELVPLPSELAAAGAKAARIRECADNDTGLTALGREFNLYADRTAKFVAPLDLYGYSGFRLVYPHIDKPVVGLATAPADYFDAINEMSRNMGVIGDLADCGMDCRAGGVLLAGDIDATCSPRIAGMYRSILLGNPTSFITACEDETADPLAGVTHWNLTESEGKKVTVHVFTIGDVVALYLDGKLVGRKLAGRINKHIATFTVEYRPGKLEAVSYCKGREICRAELETAGQPKSVKLLTGARSVSAGKGELAFLDVWVLDKDGKVAASVSPEIEFSIEGDGEAVALGNEFGPSPYINACVCSGGHALFVVRGTGEGKLTVKASSPGLLAGRITLKVKE